jgi:hypothetical protein
MTELIESLHIKNFRALAELKISSLGKVNLITGKNNSGKSSLLEAIRIMVTGGALRTLYDILDYREELRDLSDDEKSYGAEDFAPFCNLFTGFPNIASSQMGFSISAEGSSVAAQSSISVNVGWVTRKVDPERHMVSFEPVSSDLFDNVDVIPALNIEIAGRKRTLPLVRFSMRSPAMRIDADTATSSCVYLDPFSSRSTRQLGSLWDAIALTDVEKEVVKALAVISDDIQAVSMIGSDERSRSRTAIAKSSRFPAPVPLRTFGDGVNRLFGIILSLCNAKNGVLLVDEIENGLHYSVQADIWRTIFRLAKELNVQVFATSHSWDCVRAFQEAANESVGVYGSLIRLTKQGEHIVPTLFSTEELEIVARDQIEVR